jgi:hypothetical protein
MTSHTMRSCDFARVISRSWRCWYGRQREKISRWTVRDFSYGHVWKATPAARSVNQSSTRAGIPFPEALSSFPRPWETETRTCKGKERKKERKHTRAAGATTGHVPCSKVRVQLHHRSNAFRAARRKASRPWVQDKDEIAAQTGLISPPPSSLQTLN